MSNRWLRCALLLGLLFITPAPAAAISVVEPLAFGSWRQEPEVGSIGGGAAIGVASFDVVPTLEYVFVDNSRDWAITVDGHLPVLPLPFVAFYIGAGFTSYNHDPDQGEASWDSGLNVLVGAKASVLRFKPFAEIKYTTQGKDGMVYTLGTRFHLFD
jgi:membrane protease YdiL (CAAX protease family)